MVDKVLDVAGTPPRPQDGERGSSVPHWPGSRWDCGNCPHRTPSLRQAGVSEWGEEEELDVSEWEPEEF